jgi:protein-tyrosine phosphatase
MDTRADAHEIIPGVYLGNYLVASNYTLLQTMGITHVLNAAVEHPNYFENKGIIYLYLPLSDSPDEDISRFFEEGYNFIDSALQLRGKVLVHCHAGISRSTTMLASYMIKHCNKTAGDVLRHIRSIRKIVNPNHGFIVQLLDYIPRKNLPVSSNHNKFDNYSDFSLEGYTTV